MRQIYACVFSPKIALQSYQLWRVASKYTPGKHNLASGQNNDHHVICWLFTIRSILQICASVIQILQQNFEWFWACDSPDTEGDTLIECKPTTFLYWLFMCRSILTCHTAGKWDLIWTTMASTFPNRPYSMKVWWYGLHFRSMSQQKKTGRVTNKPAQVIQDSRFRAIPVVMQYSEVPSKYICKRQTPLTSRAILAIWSKSRKVVSNAEQLLNSDTLYVIKILATKKMII